MRVEQLDHYQRVPLGTAAWYKSIGRRQVVEGINSRLHLEMAMERGIMRAFGTVAATITVTMLSAALNLRIARHDDYSTDIERGLEPYDAETEAGTLGVLPLEPAALDPPLE